MRPKRLHSFFVALALAAAAAGYPARVVAIADGDTCTVVAADRQPIKIRLAGIDTPERSQPFGPQAKQALSSKISNRIVDVQAQTTDRYNRIVADLYLGKRWINLELIRDGWAWHYKQYSSDPRLAQSEQSARRQHKGLWRAPEPMPPWRYRNRAHAKPHSAPTHRAPAGTGHWLNTATGVRHNSNCRYYKETNRGTPCNQSAGKACRICGG